MKVQSFEKLALLSIFLCIALISVRAEFDGSYQAQNTFQDVDAKYDTQQKSVNYSVNYLDSHLMDLHWCGKEGNVIFFLTQKNKLYRSKDNGFTGQTLSDHLKQIGLKELGIIGQKSEDVGEVLRIIPSPVDKNLVLFEGTKGINWITQDCGETVKAMNQGRKVDQFELHPTQRSWILASAWTLCEDFAGEPCKKYRELFVSKDLGENWEQIASYVAEFAWGKPDNVAVQVPDERIIICNDPNGQGHQNFQGWSDKLVVQYSDDFFKTTKIISSTGNKFLLTQHFLFTVSLVSHEDQEVRLEISSSRKSTYTMRTAELPHKHLYEHSYTILDTSEHSVFIQINHEGGLSKYGNIYASDSTGVRYNLALQYNVRDIDGQCDFERVQGVDGIYLANVFEKEAVKQYQEVETRLDMPIQGGGKGFGAVDEYGQSIRKKLKDSMKTVISFDKGSVWRQLTPPLYDSFGKKIYCKAENCHLHLHSLSNNEFGPFYTTANSMGIIIGTGNVGEYLSHNDGEINTYLSRDGGVTWDEIAKGSHIYEIGDHGSILVMAPNTIPVDYVIYSWNEGKSWHKLKITEGDQKVIITNIIIEPTNTAEKFVVYGTYPEGQANSGLVAAVDFFPLHDRWCKGADKPETTDSDYEYWNPHSEAVPNCLLGRDMKYLRKKRDAECFNSEATEKWSYSKACQCTESDWECDFDYFRKDGEGACVSSTTLKPADIHNFTTPEYCQDFFYISQGYRKVSGDTCYGGVDHEPLKVRCPGASWVSANNLGIMLLLAGVIMGVVWLGKSNNSAVVLDKVAGVINTFKGAIPSFKKQKDDIEFQGIDAIPDSLRDEDDDFANMDFGNKKEEDADDKDYETVDIFGVKGKKMTTGRGAAATQKVPAIRGPGTKSRESGGLLDDF